MRNLGILLAEDICADTRRRELVGAGNAKLGLCLKHTRGRDARVVVLLKGGVNPGRLASISRDRVDHPSSTPIGKTTTSVNESIKTSSPARDRSNLIFFSVSYNPQNLE
jgi:hypothetical protein